jgi:probable rRNA maturation factor
MPSRTAGGDLPPVDIQISVEAGDWPPEDALEHMTRRVVQATMAYLAEETAQPFPDEEAELSLLFTDDTAMQAINGQWRAQDKPTNVLSFPGSAVAPGQLPTIVLGDIVFAEQTIRREAADLTKSFDDHLTHLLVHGFLHLLGYDHMQTDEAETMERHETRILAVLGLSDPYGTSVPHEQTTRR